MKLGDRVVTFELASGDPVTGLIIEIKDSGLLKIRLASGAVIVRKKERVKLCDT